MATNKGHLNGPPDESVSGLSTSNYRPDNTNVFHLQEK